MDNDQKAPPADSTPQNLQDQMAEEAKAAGERAASALLSALLQ